MGRPPAEPPAPPPARDPGLQPERTRLAWRRATLTMTVVALLAGRQVIQDRVTATGLLAAALSALVWLAFLVLAHRRIVALDTSRPRALSVRAAVAAALCAVCLTAFGMAVLL